MDQAAPAIVDPLHLFTATQAAVVSRSIERQALIADCRIQVVVGKGTAGAAKMAGAVKGMSGVDARIVVDETTMLVAGLGLNGTACLGDADAAKGIELGDIIEPTAKALNALAGKDSTLNGALAGKSPTLETETLAVVKAFRPALNTSAAFVENAAANAKASPTPDTAWEDYRATLIFSLSITLVVFVLLALVPLCGLARIARVISWWPRSAGRRALYLHERDLRKTLFQDDLGPLFRRPGQKNAFFDKMGHTIGSLRDSALARDGKDAWCALYDGLLANTADLTRRVKLFYRHEANASKEEREIVQDGLLKELGDIADDLIDLDASLKPRLTADVMAEILAVPSADPALSEALRERVRAIDLNAQRLEDSLSPQMSEESYVVKAIRSRYVPDTIAAYRHAHSSAPEAAERMLDEQLSTIEEGVLEASRAVVAQNMGMLRANGEFLRARFCNQTTYKLDAKGH